MPVGRNNSIRDLSGAKIPSAPGSRLELRVEPSLVVSDVHGVLSLVRNLMVVLIKLLAVGRNNGFG